MVTHFLEKLYRSHATASLLRADYKIHLILQKMFYNILCIYEIRDLVPIDTDCSVYLLWHLVLSIILYILSPLYYFDLPHRVTFANRQPRQATFSGAGGQLLSL